MNTILQKRIEEAAKRYAWSHDTIGVDKETFHTEASQKHSIPIDKHVRVPIQHEMEVAFKCAAHFILNKLWISVEEALPDYDEVVMVIDGTDEENLPVTAHRSPNKSDVVQDSHEFCLRWIKQKITHWMSIPPMKGGEDE